LPLIGFLLLLKRDIIFPMIFTINKRRPKMKVNDVAKIWIDYHATHSKKKYRPVV
jgi:hypothetical protein